MPTALERFVAKCRFDPGSGCVIWVGGTTSGQGHSAPYGAFWFEGRRWFAHRWAAKYIHGLDIDGKQVDHCCPGRYPQTLCVHHLQSLDAHANRDLQTARERQFWLLVQKGYEEGPPRPSEPFTQIPWHEPPDWIRNAHPSPLDREAGRAAARPVGTAADDLPVDDRASARTPVQLGVD